jgi:hypothetical protein
MMTANVWLSAPPVERELWIFLATVDYVDIPPSFPAKSDLPMIELLLAHGADPGAKTRIDKLISLVEEAENRKLSEAVQLLKKCQTGYKSRSQAMNRRPPYRPYVPFYRACS